jgi:hypothetical protein
LDDPNTAAGASHIAIMILCLFHQIELSMNSCSPLLIFGNTQIHSRLVEGPIGRKTRRRDATSKPNRISAIGTFS